MIRMNEELKKLTLPQMLSKLDELYAREEEVIFEAKQLKKEYEQLQEDKEFLQTMIMYLSNKSERMR